MAPKVDRSRYNANKKHKAKEKRTAGFDEIAARNRGEDFWAPKEEADGEVEEEEEEEEENDPKVFKKSSGNAMAAAMVGMMANQDEMKNEAPELSRKQREEMEKERKKRNYEKAHARGETDEAKADLARLKKIKEQREAAKAAREEEARKQKEAEEAAKAKAKAGSEYVAALGGDKAGTGSRNKKSKKKVETGANQMDDFQDGQFKAKLEEEKKAQESIEALAGSIDACRLAEDDFM